MEDRKCLLRVNNVSRTYVTGDVRVRALDSVSFEVYQGEFLLILGESGCGKTTLLNIMGGMDRPNGGDVFFGDLNVAKASRKQLTNYRRNNVGFVFQNYLLMPNLTVKQNLEIIAELVKEPLNIDELLSLVNLSDKRDTYPSLLSGGQQQRVSIARALIKKPLLVLADEPTAALDYRTGVEILATFERVKNSGTTIVMISHNEEIAKMADRVLYLKNGKLINISNNDRPLRATDLEW